MAQNPNGAAECSIEVFGSWVTETSPENLPVGVSPDCPDNVFAPGMVGTRPAFQKIFNPPLEPGSTITYGKSFVTPSGDIRNLFLSSLGNFYVEDVSVAPGVANLLFTTTPGTYAKSVTAFGREFIAISDGLHGQEAPLQYDGTNLDRVTQDGPGTPPKISNLILAASTLQSYASTSGAFVILPVLGGGTVALGAGNGANGTTIPLPAGFAAARLLTFSSALAGFDPAHAHTGVASSTVVAGVMNSFLQQRSGGTTPATTSWVALSWTSDAAVTVTSIGGITYVSFTTSNGDPVCFAGGVLTSASPRLPVPAGFFAAQFVNIAGPAGVNPTSNGLQYVRVCGLDGTLTETLIYDDNNGDRWTGPVNAFGMFYQLGGGIATQAVAGGTAVIVPLSASQQMCLVQASLASGSSFGLPAAFVGAPFLVSACAPNAVGTTSGSNTANGWTLGVAGQLYTGIVRDGGSNTWTQGGAVFAISTIGAALGGSLVRQNNTVTAQTLTAHNLQVGYQAQISNVPASAVGGGIVSIAIDNENNPGIATVTTAAAHGLLPDLDVTLTGIAATVVGTSIVSATRAGDVTTIATSTPHGLSPSAQVTTAGVADASFNGNWPVLAVVDATHFTFTDVDVDATSAGGTVSLNWPVPDTPTPTFFQVISAPTPTTFQVAVVYTDGNWTGGVVSFAWNGTFYVTEVLSPTSFEYQQYGPNASTQSDGTVTPFGQAAPGLHQFQMSFLTRQGYLTKPSPPVSVVLNGGQYVKVDDMAIGGPNIVARVIEATGALGSLFFYLPVAGQVNGLVVSTGTQINDNTTTSVVLDFSDRTLFTGLGTSIPGNNLAAQIVLDGALGFLYSSTRLGTAGQRNRLQSLLNMGFDGGYLASAPTLPTGWTAVGAGGALGAGRFNGFNWQINTGVGPGTLSQSFYQDGYGAPIGISNTLYKVRYYLAGAGTFQAKISSASTGFAATATIVSPATGWYEATFSAETPNSIPVDMLYTISGIAGTFTVDEGSVIYAQTPYTDTLLFDSYVNNPEGIDGLTGKYGASQDTRKVMAWGIVRGNLCLLTQEPSGRLHEVIDNGTSEPIGWSVNQLEANCGVLSAFALTVSQADDSSASGGEEWMAWASESGARIFGGGDQWKISQEIQPNWFDPLNPAQVGAGQINMAAALTAWALNDPVERVIYFGLPLGASTTPSQVYPMNYREMDDAYTIAHSPPFHPSLAGKLVATDNTRKWCYWQRAFNGAARMYRGPGQLTTCFFSGAFGNVYLLNPAMSTDDDYGRIGSYYITCALPTHDQEQGLQLGSQKKMLAYLSASFTCVGNVMFTIFRNKLAFPWPITFTRPSCTYFDMEMPGGNPEANRMFFKIQPVPLPGQTDNRYSLTRFIPFFRKAKIPARGAAQ